MQLEKIFAAMWHSVVYQKESENCKKDLERKKFTGAKNKIR